MSNCCANSASVLSPRTAARATFALKAGVWFRRGRLVIVSPGLQPFWLLSGRNSTYPAVQIFRASSDRTVAVLQADADRGDVGVPEIVGTFGPDMASQSLFKPLRGVAPPGAL